MRLRAKVAATTGLHTAGLSRGSVWPSPCVLVLVFPVLVVLVLVDLVLVVLVES